MNTKSRERMLRDIQREVEFTRHEIGTDHLDERVMEAIRAVPRHEFVPLESRPYAYENGPVAIGHGQTISQPYIVALMSDLLRPRPQDVVLEVGTGSGYQAAVLSRLVRQVYSVEIVEELASEVAERLQRLGYHNVAVRHGDGYYGWPEHAPYDSIIVTAAAPHIPSPLIEQLKVGGRLVIPVGQPLMYQELKVVEKVADDKTQVHDVLGVAFVPLVGGHAARREGE
jgi:protein-L-isoaspartate(D-aspartate) O-methyltransferase